MKKQILAATVMVAVVVPVGVVEAQTIKPTPKHVRQYKHLYHAVSHKFGARAPGRNIIRWGIGNKPGHGPAPSDVDVRRSIDVLQRMLTPPRVATLTVPQGSTVQQTNTIGSVSSSTVISTASPSASGSGNCGGNTPYAGGGQCWAIPYSIVSCESGGQNVPNSQGSGANGYYQLMNGGTGSRAEQDAAAAKLWAGGAGAGAWVCK